MSDKPFHVEMSIRIKTYDIDFVGHVNNIVYIRWLEDLRLQLLDDYYPLEKLRSEGKAPIIVNTQIHYRQGIILDDHTVHASMWVSKLERVTLYLAAEFRVRESLRATASQRGTFIDTAKMRPIRIPEPFRLIFDQSP